ncbi:hypothetical protein N7532_010283 [Penicillium argentinense]|uniref:Wax synthase domain-containing protein n=1 Tax=Penicillium argentinense TaxID=1131581 RepID=A0A9W9EPB6_9EURO|nr:uncharacterized protein N7532_010283 [Penicillium argentinense]KAJ5085512.1 hypothetical protein N7532_010283 [Penicillium argentinense]
MVLFSDIVDFTLSSSLQHFIPAALLVATPKGSPYRYLAIPLLILMGSLFVRPMDLTAYVRANAIGSTFTVVITAINLLLVNPLDERDLAREKPNTFFRSGHVYYTFEVFLMPRGIATPRQVKNVPEQPAYLTRHGKEIPVGRFLLRQVVILAWQFLVVDLFQELGRQRALESGYQPGFKPIPYDVPLEKWIERGATHILAWFIIGRLLIDCPFRLASILFVGLGLDTPANWPPAFGRLKDVYTLRHFWSKFWHQFLRQHFTGMSNFISRDVLHLSRPSILERYTNVFIVFLQSAIMHIMIDFVAGIPWKLSGTVAFFMSFVLGFMIEDGVQALWNSIFPPTKTEDGKILTPLWKKVVGMLWTMTWIAVWSTPYLERSMQLPANDLMPIGVVDKTGVTPVGGAICVGAILLCLTVGPEI